MSGHSKWATTKRAKAVVDAKKGAIFTKLANLITIAAREKGGDPTINFSLRMAMDKARAVNMPKDNVERAIKRGTGEGGNGVQIEELVYEAVGPANTQFVVRALTDSKNRTASLVKHIFSKHGGALSPVMWNFEQKGVIMIAAEGSGLDKLDFEEFELELADAGADDVKKEEGGAIIYTKMEDLQKVKKFLEEKDITTESAAIEYVAKDTISLNDEDQEKIDKIIDALDDCEDVSDYFLNVAS